MPYGFNLQDEHLRIVTIRLFEPLQTEDVNALSQRLRALLDPPAPLFILLDIREFNLMRGLSGLPHDLDEMPLPDFAASHVKQSRMAIVGRGGLLSLILGLTRSDGELPQVIRQFTHEDEGLAWLYQEAQRILGSGPATF